MLVIADPTVFEIQEMLDFVEKAHDLGEILPPPTAEMSQADFLKMGWCYLFYDSKTLEPLGYAAFSFVSKNYNPYFYFGTTPFAKPHHIFIGRRAMLNVMRVALKNRVKVYIDNERIMQLAKSSGFRKSTKHDKQNKFIWIKER